jgi:hypothetical protein
MVSHPIRGEQLSLRIVLPDLPQANPAPGEPISTASGQAIVTHTELAGQERIIWADYGSGIAQPHISEGLFPPEQPLQVGDQVRVRRGCCAGLVSTVTAIQPDLAHSIQLEPGKGRYRPELLERIGSPPEPFPSPERSRRHSPKGQASGWIEERIGNRKRRNPSTSYYYRWQDESGRHSRYIPAGKLWRVQQMVEVEGKTIAEILEVLEVPKS